jgi:hypothetical protein
MKEIVTQWEQQSTLYIYNVQYSSSTCRFFVCESCYLEEEKDRTRKIRSHDFVG